LLPVGTGLQMLELLHSCGRRVVAGALIYALLLQGLVFSAEFAQAAAGDPTVAGFELCSHTGGAASADQPAQPPAGGTHCPFCVAGAISLNAPPPCAPHYHNVEFSAAAWHSTAPRLIALFINESAWPRGPPSAA
jgi:hypothetical protein